MSPRTKAQFEEIREASEQKILDAALTLFGELGFEATSISQIASKAGVSKGLIYNYFDSKDDLLQKLIYSLSSKEESMLDGIADDDPSRMLENIITVVFKEFRENMDTWKLIISLTIQLEKFAFIHDLALAKLNAYVQLLEDLLARIGFEDPREEAMLLCALFDGIAMQALIIKGDYHLDDVQRMLVKKYCKQ